MPYNEDGAVRRAIELYESGARMSEVAETVKRNQSGLWAKMKAAGVRARPRGISRRTKFDVQKMIKEYIAGESIMALARQYGVARIVIDQRLKENQVKKRSASQQAYITAAKTDPAVRAARAEKAHAASRGRKTPEDVLCRNAINRQMGARMTPKEKEFAERFAAAGIPVVPQYAVGRYSVDLAIPDARIAIEVKSGWSFSKAKKTKDLVKQKALENRGWIVLSVTGSKWCQFWAERIKPFVEERQAMRLGHVSSESPSSEKSSPA